MRILPNRKARLQGLRRSGLVLAASVALAAAWIWLSAAAAAPEPPAVQFGAAVPRDVREMYDRGARFLARTQLDDGNWNASSGQGAAIMALGTLVFLAAGDDPNFGPYAQPIRKALRGIVLAQNESTGYIGQSMYHHGFAMLALAEAYGAVDERTLWPDGDLAQGNRRSLGVALELAVRAAITSQRNNPHAAWRYSAESRDADTSVSGAVLVGLLAARNAGIEVPEEAIDKAIEYYKAMTAPSGEVAYSGIGSHGNSQARSSIAALVFAIAHRKDLSQFKSAMNCVLGQRDAFGMHYLEYTRYYQAQALYQGNIASWEKWNGELAKGLIAEQQKDGSFPGTMAPPENTALNLLALAVAYRLLPIYER